MEALRQNLVKLSQVEDRRQPFPSFSFPFSSSGQEFKALLELDLASSLLNL